MFEVKAEAEAEAEAAMLQKTTSFKIAERELCSKTVVAVAQVLCVVASRQLVVA